MKKLLELFKNWRVKSSTVKKQDKTTKKSKKAAVKVMGRELFKDDSDIGYC